MMTRRVFATAVLLLGLTGSLAAQGGPPAGATGKCKDGTYTMSTTKKGACSKHGGVDTWLGAATTVKAGAPTPAPAPTPPPPPAPKPKSSMTGAAPAGAPAGATALCTDGTYSMSQHRRGTCSKHKGVKTWLKQVPA